MIPDIPSPLLRSFVAVVECGSLAAAASRVGRSESALSLQMARLEDVIGRPLFDRDGRALKLNRTGAQLLPHAKAILGRIDAVRAELAQGSAPPIRIGIIQDFADPILRPVLAGLDSPPGHPLSVIVGSSADLLHAMGEERIDTALVMGDLPGALACVRLPVRWFGDPALASAEVVPLVAITPPCPFLDRAQRALDAAGRPWRLALVTPSLEGLRAAVLAGLGVTCRTEAGIGLPPLPEGMLPYQPDIACSVIGRRHAGEGFGTVATALANHLQRLATGSRP